MRWQSQQFQFLYFTCLANKHLIQFHSHQHPHRDHNNYDDNHGNQDHNNDDDHHGDLAHYNDEIIIRRWPNSSGSLRV